MLTRYITHGDGSKSQFDLPFPYDDKNDVHVQVDEIEVTYSWLTASRIELPYAPAGGTEILIYRQTPIANPDVVFEDAALLSQEDLNGAVNQLLHRAQEIDDTYADSLNRAIKVNPGETLEALPPAALRASKFLSFDASGQPFLSSGSGGGDASLRSDFSSPDGLVLAGFNQGEVPFIQTRRALDKLREIGASVRDTGGVGDGSSDDTEALQEIFDYFAEQGGQWHLPDGTWKTTSELLINCEKPQRIIGGQKRGVYPGKFILGTSTGPTILPVHAGRNTIRFAGTTNGNGSITLEGVNLATLETGSMPTAAFGWDTNDIFLRDFTFLQCGIHGFTSAFDSYKSGGSNTQVGLFKTRNCNINRNSWIARTLDGTQWNGFSFVENEAGQNGYPANTGGINIAAHAVRIIGNSLEGMRDAVRVFGSYRGVAIKGNYFEANVGKACVELSDVYLYEVGPNTFIGLNNANLDHKVLLTNVSNGSCVDPAYSSGVHKSPLPIIGNHTASDINRLNNTAGTPYLRVDRLEGATFARLPEYKASARARVSNAVREIHPQNGRVMPAQELVSSGTGIVTYTYNIAGTPGDWVVMSWLVKRLPDAGAKADPYITLNVNGTGDAGTQSFVPFNWDNNWRDGEWALVTCATKLGATMTSLQTSLYPFGISPASGRTAHYLRPYVYTVDDINKVIPYIENFMALSVTAAPATGTWVAGDYVDNANPAVAGDGRFLYTGTAWIH